jgi:PAS domain S-box-containing protein
MRTDFSLTENQWEMVLAVLSGSVLLVTAYCLSRGITIIFMHLYYLPIVLLAYHYRRRGVYLSILLSLSYLVLVLVLVPGDSNTFVGAVFRVIVFIGIAALIAYLTEELVQARDALGRTAEVQQSIIQNANVWLTVLDARGRILVWNRAAERISGYPEAEVLGKADIWKSLYPDRDYRRMITGTITRIIAGHNYLDNFESEIRAKDGSIRIISWNTREMTGDGIRQKQYITIGLDITKRKQADRELEEANIRLRELDRLKSLFIASMSHELRTPLNSIIGFTGILVKGMAGPVNAEQKKQLGMVQDSARHLLALINDVIDISKIEAGKIEAGVSAFNLADVFSDIRNTFDPVARDQGLVLHLEIPPPLIITSDERRIRQVVINLISNAIKFTDEGSVDVRTELKGDFVEIRVRDTGIGIGREDADRLFHPFARVNVEGRLTEGTGLGLYLSKKLARFLGGDITVESEMHKGSEFLFRFPVTYVPQENS